MGVALATPPILWTRRLPLAVVAMMEWQPLPREDILLVLYVVFFNTMDFHDVYVVRAQYVLRTGQVGVNPEPHYVGPTLDLARASIPPGFVNVGRQPGDSPGLLEVWV